MRLGNLDTNRANGHMKTESEMLKLYCHKPRNARVGWHPSETMKREVRILRDFGGAWPCQHVDFCFLDSRAAR